MPCVWIDFCGSDVEVEEIEKPRKVLHLKIEDFESFVDSSFGDFKKYVLV